MKRSGPVEGEATPPPLTPEGAKLYERNKAATANSDAEIDTVLKCMPAGLPRSLLSGNPFYLAQTAKAIIWVGGSGGRPQIIYMEDKHQGLWPRYMGDSIGHWQQDTLVVDVIDLTAKTFLHDNSMPHSDSLHVVERLRLLDGGKTLQNQITLDDPAILSKPWVMTVLYDRTENKPLEDVCENARLRP